MDTKIAHSPFTVEWVTSKIRQSVPGAENATVDSWEVNQMDEYQGFLSEIVRMKLRWSNDKNGALPTSIVIKFPSIHGLKSGLHPVVLDYLPANLVDIMHKKECDLYEKLGGDDSAVPLAKYYFGQNAKDDQPGVIVLGDMAKQGGLVPLWESQGLEKALSFAKVLARFHAFCLKNPEKWNQDFHPKVVEEYLVLPALYAEIRKSLAGIIPDELLEAASCHLETENAHKNVTIHEKLGLPSILVQGDPWSENLMFKKEASGQLGDELLALLDWQECHAGSMLEDLTRFLVSSCSPEDRMQYLPQVVSQYHETLHSELKRLGCDFSVELQTLLDLYKAQLPYAMGYFTIEVAMLLTRSTYQGPEGEEKAGAILHRLGAIMQEVAENMADQR